MGIANELKQLTEDPKFHSLAGAKDEFIKKFGSIGDKTSEYKAFIAKKARDYYTKFGKLPTWGKVAIGSAGVLTAATAAAIARKRRAEGTELTESPRGYAKQMTAASMMSSLPDAPRPTKAIVAAGKEGKTIKSFVANSSDYTIKGLKEKAKASINKVQASSASPEQKAKLIERIKNSARKAYEAAKGHAGKAVELAKAHPAIAAAPLAAAGVAYGAYKLHQKKTRKESENLIGGNMFKNTLEDVITERFLNYNISPEKYVSLMEKIEVMSEGKALDILQEITLAGIKTGAAKFGRVAKRDIGIAGKKVGKFAKDKLDVKGLNDTIKIYERNLSSAKHGAADKEFIDKLEKSIKAMKKKRAIMLGGYGTAGVGASVGAGYVAGNKSK